MSGFSYYWRGIRTFIYYALNVPERPETRSVATSGGNFKTWKSDGLSRWTRVNIYTRNNSKPTIQQFFRPLCSKNYRKFIWMWQSYMMVQTDSVCLRHSKQQYLKLQTESFGYRLQWRSHMLSKILSVELIQSIKSLYHCEFHSPQGVFIYTRLI